MKRIFKMKWFHGYDSMTSWINEQEDIGRLSDNHMDIINILKNGPSWVVCYWEKIIE